MLQTEAVFGYDPDANPLLIYFFIVVLIFIFFIVPTIEIGCIVMILSKLKEMKAVMSQRTYKLHKNLLLALTVQILLPQFMILIPDVGIVFGAWKEWPNVNVIAETTLMLCTCHSVLDNFVMLFVITPYRRALLGVIQNSVFKNYEIHFSLHRKENTVTDKHTNSIHYSQSHHSVHNGRRTFSSPGRSLVLQQTN